MFPFPTTMSRLYRMLLYLHLVMLYVSLKSAVYQPLESFELCRSSFPLFHMKWVLSLACFIDLIVCRKHNWWAAFYLSCLTIGGHRAGSLHRIYVSSRAYVCRFSNITSSVTTHLVSCSVFGFDFSDMPRAWSCGVLRSRSSGPARFETSMPYVSICPMPAAFSKSFLKARISRPIGTFVKKCFVWLTLLLYGLSICYPKYVRVEESAVAFSIYAIS